MGGERKVFITVGAILVLLMAPLLTTMANPTETKLLCGMTQRGIDSCQPSVTAVRPGAVPPSPAKECCAALSGADMKCLCSFKNSPLLPALGIDPKLAMQLPVKCRLPRFRHC